MRRRVVLVSLALVALLVAGFVLRLLWRAGTFRGIEPHFAGTCRLVPGAVGSEDLTIHPRTGLALISSSDRRADRAGRPVPGAIWAYDPEAESPELVNLTPSADASFQPHGISLWAGEDGRDALFVINHPPPQTGLPENTIEIFDLLEGPRLVHRATLTDPLLVMINDLVAVDIDRFYVTRTHRYPPGGMQAIETYLQLSGAQVLFYGPGGFRSAIEDLVYPNGINVSPDGRTLYVAAVSDMALRVYERDPARESLRLREVVPLPGGPDNIEVAADGSLWIGAHPKLLRVGAHAADPAARSPSQVLRVTPDGRVDEVYLDSGEQISAASVAAVRGRRLLIGQIFDDGFLDCRMN